MSGGGMSGWNPGGGGGASGVNLLGGGGLAAGSNPYGGPIDTGNEAGTSRSYMGPNPMAIDPNNPNAYADLKATFDAADFNSGYSSSAYDQYIQQQAAAAQGYGGIAAQSLNVNAPQISHLNLAGMNAAGQADQRYIHGIQQGLAGHGPNLGAAQYRVGQGQAIDAAMAGAHSPGGWMGAEQGAGNSLQGAAAQAGMTQAGVQGSLQGQLGQGIQTVGQLGASEAGLSQQQAIEQAQLAQAQMGGNRAFAGQMYQLGQAASEQQLAGLQGAQTAGYETAGIDLGQSQLNQQMTQAYLGAGMSVGGALLSAPNWSGGGLAAATPSAPVPGLSGQWAQDNSTPISSYQAENMGLGGLGYTGAAG